MIILPYPAPGARRMCGISAIRVSLNVVEESCQRGVGMTAWMGAWDRLCGRDACHTDPCCDERRLNAEPWQVNQIAYDESSK